MSILLFSNDKCFYYHILVCQGRIPLILLLLFLKKYTERCGKTRRENYGYSIVQIYPGLAVFSPVGSRSEIHSQIHVNGQPGGLGHLLLLRVPSIDLPCQGLPS